jgi:acetoacetyl-CoA reductase
MKRVAIVTGGTRGIGACISKALQKEGYLVAANYCGNDAAALAFQEETGMPVFKWDVGDTEACAEGLRKVEAELGAVCTLVNNAGITRDSMLHKMDYEQWSTVMRVNLDAMFNMTRPLINGMRDRSFGRIINISSINGQKGQTNYSAAKAGVIGFTKALAQETARKGITVNCICPGYIDTDMVSAVPKNVLEGIVSSIPVGRLGTAEEVADLVCFLARRESAFITGSVIAVNGGQYIANG